jgi:hypothetical protein
MKSLSTCQPRININKLSLSYLVPDPLEQLDRHHCAGAAAVDRENTPGAVLGEMGEQRRCRRWQVRRVGEERRCGGSDGCRPARAVAGGMGREKKKKKSESCRRCIFFFFFFFFFCTTSPHPTPPQPPSAHTHLSDPSIFSPHAMASSSSRDVGGPSTWSTRRPSRAAGSPQVPAAAVRTMESASASVASAMRFVSLNASSHRSRSARRRSAGSPPGGRRARFCSHWGRVVCIFFFFFLLYFKKLKMSRGNAKQIFRHCRFSSRRTLIPCTFMTSRCAALLRVMRCTSASSARRLRFSGGGPPGRIDSGLWMFFFFSKINFFFFFVCGGGRR